MKNPFDVVKSRYVTEKSMVLEELQNRNSNRSLARCKSPKVVFIVDSKASKTEIKDAVEAIYKEKEVKVKSVNTLHVKRKPKRRGRGRPGQTPSFKKAIVTLTPGDTIEKE